MMKARSGQTTAPAITAARGACSRISPATWRITLYQGQNDHGKCRPQGEEHAYDEKLSGNEKENADRDENAVSKGREGIGAQPGALAGRLYGGDGVLYAKGIALRQIAEVLVGPVGHVGDLQIIGEDVVRIEAEQRVPVEEQGGEAGHEYDVIGDRAHGAGLRKRPDDEGNGRE